MPRRSIHISIVTAPPDRNTTPHTSDTHSAGAPIQRVSCSSATKMAATTAAPKFWMATAVRRSLCASLPFWYSEPAVIDPTASTETATTSHAGAAPGGGATPPVTFGASTSATPARPSAMPNQPRAGRRSLNSGTASTAVASGCSAPSSAMTPAFSPCATAQ